MSGKDILCGIWCVLCMIFGTIALFWLGINSVLIGFAVFTAAVMVGLIPFLLLGDGDYQEMTASNGFFSILFLCVVRFFKILFCVIAFIVTLGCIRYAGKKFGGLK